LPPGRLHEDGRLELFVSEVAELVHPESVGLLALGVLQVVRPDPVTVGLELDLPGGLLGLAAVGLAVASLPAPELLFLRVALGEETARGDDQRRHC
jgi:hypothetical protein